MPGARGGCWAGIRPLLWPVCVDNDEEDGFCTAGAAGAAGVEALGAAAGAPVMGRPTAVEVPAVDTAGLADSAVDAGAVGVPALAAVAAAGV